MLLRDWIIDHKKKVTAFALEIGVTRDCVQKYMSGKRRPTDQKVLQKIFEATGGDVTANDFFYDLSIAGHIKKPKIKVKKPRGS